MLLKRRTVVRAGKDGQVQDPGTQVEGRVYFGYRDDPGEQCWGCQ
jgi:hypothetical protein